MTALLYKHTTVCPTETLASEPCNTTEFVLGKDGGYVTLVPSSAAAGVCHSNVNLLYVCDWIRFVETTLLFSLRGELSRPCTVMFLSYPTIEGIIDRFVDLKIK